MCFTFLNLIFNRQNKKEKTNLKCPKCNKFMKKLIKYNIEIDVCPFCNGMWLDDKEIDALLNLYKEKTKVIKNGKERTKK